MTTPTEIENWAVDQGLPGAGQNNSGSGHEVNAVLLSQNGRGTVAALAETVVYRRQVDGDHELKIRASGIRRERTGVHAKLEILLNSVVLGWSNFNIERDEERQRLSHKAHLLFGKAISQAYQKELLRHEVDTFCSDLWNAHVRANLPEDIPGNPDLELTFRLRPYIVEGGGTIIFAPPGRGKSYTLMLMAVSIDAGVNDIWPVSQAKVLFVNLERSSVSIQRRLGFVNTALGLDANRRLYILNARGKSLADIRETVAAAVEEKGVQTVMLDSISRTGMGSLVDDRAVNATVDILNRIAPTWCAVGHTPRGDESHLYGSVHFEAGADVVVKLLSERQDDRLGIGLEITKENDIGQTDKQILSYSFDRSGLHEVRPAEPGEFLDTEAGAGASVADQAEEYLLEYGKATATMIAKEYKLNRGAVSHALNHDKRFVRLGKQDGTGNQVFFGVRSRS